MARTLRPSISMFAEADADVLVTHESLPSTRNVQLLNWDGEVGAPHRVEFQPAHISVRIPKASIHSVNLGLTLVNPTLVNLAIGHIDPDSPLANSSIHPGFLLQSINGESSLQMIPQVAYRHIQAHIDDLILVFNDPIGNSMYAQAVVIYEATAPPDIGVAFAQTNGLLSIQNIAQNGLFSNSLLQTNDSVVSIDGIACQTSTPSEAIELARHNPRFLDIVTAIPSERRAQIVTTMTCEAIGDEEVTVEADELESLDLEEGSEESEHVGEARFLSIHVLGSCPEVTEGLELEREKNKGLVVVKIPESGPLAMSPLRPGCVIQSINQQLAIDIRPGVALKWMRNTQDTTLDLTVVNPRGDPTCVHAVAYKTSGSAIGIVFRRKTLSSPLLIQHISSDSVFANSVLNEGDVVLSVNGIDCEHKDPADVVFLVHQDPDFASIMAKCEHESAIVLGSQENKISRSFQYKMVGVIVLNVVMYMLVIGTR